MFKVRGSTKSYKVLLVNYTLVMEIGTLVLSLLLSTKQWV